MGRPIKAGGGTHDLWQLLIVPSANLDPFSIIEIPIFYCHCFLFITSRDEYECELSVWVLFHGPSYSDEI